MRNGPLLHHGFLSTKLVGFVAPLAPLVIVSSAGCFPPNVVYDLGATGGSTTSATTSTMGTTSSSGNCSTATSMGAGCGPGTIGGLTGDFDNTADWLSFNSLPNSNVMLQPGKVVVTTDGTPGQYSAAFTTNNVRLAGCEIFVHVTPPPSGDTYTTYIDIADDSKVGVEVVKVGSYFQIAILGPGTNTIVKDVLYDPSAQAWWRVREAGGTVHVETSSDACNWTEQGSTATPALDGGVGVDLGFGVPGMNPKLAPATASFDHLNVLP
jgi:hypothetical protein